MKNLYRLSLASLLVASLLPLSAWAVPGQLTYTGYVTKGGTPLNTGASSMAITFRIFSAPTGGLLPLWEEKISGVSVVNGVFTVVLGKTKSLSAGLFDGNPYYMEIVLGTQAMSPRVPLRTVPYAFTSENCTGDITPKSMKVGGKTVIDSTGKWVGDTAGLKGDKGDKGDTGAAGLQGLKGDKGDTGAAGLNGDTGATGAAGATGATGATGAQGPYAKALTCSAGSAVQKFDGKGTAICGKSWYTTAESDKRYVRTHAIWSTGTAGQYSLRKIFDTARTGGLVLGGYDCVLRTNNAAHWTGRRFTAAVTYYKNNSGHPHKFHNVIDVQASTSGCSAGLTSFTSSTGAFSFTPGNCYQAISLVCNRIS